VPICPLVLDVHRKTPYWDSTGEQVHAYGTPNQEFEEAVLKYPSSIHMHPCEMGETEACRIGQRTWSLLLAQEWTYLGQDWMFNAWSGVHEYGHTWWSYTMTVLFAYSRQSRLSSQRWRGTCSWCQVHMLNPNVFSWEKENNHHFANFAFDPEHTKWLVSTKGHTIKAPTSGNWSVLVR